LRFEHIAGELQSSTEASTDAPDVMKSAGRYPQAGRRGDAIGSRLRLRRRHLPSSCHRVCRRPRERARRACRPRSAPRESEPRWSARSVHRIRLPKIQRPTLTCGGSSHRDRPALARYPAEHRAAVNDQRDAHDRHTARTCLGDSRVALRSVDPAAAQSGSTYGGPRRHARSASQRGWVDVNAVLR
jgi:hypothetical protein